MLRDSSIKHVIAHNIKKYREQNGIKQSELASVIGTTNKNLSNWENEVSSPDMDTLHNIAAALGITMNDIFSDDESMAKEFDVSNGKFFDNVAKICDEKGISTQEMCAEIDLPYAVYKNYEKNNSGRISLNLITDIVKALGVSPELLINWTSEVNNITATVSGVKKNSMQFYTENKTLNQIIEIISILPDEALAHLDKYVRFMADEYKNKED